MEKVCYSIALAAALFLVWALLADPRKSLAALEQTTIRHWSKLITLVLAYFLLDQAMLRLPMLVFRIPGTHWNWLGKLFSIAFSGLLLARSPWLRRNVGVRWRQASGSLPLALICVAACIAESIHIGLGGRPIAFSWDTLLFQAFIPSIDEELFYRGISLALLERAFARSPMSCRLRYGWAALVISVVFGIEHALTFQEGHFRFLMEPFLITFAFASVATLVRTRSGSLLWPILCHTAINLPLDLILMIRYA